MGRRKLTLKQERFVKEYLIDLNATQAAIRAGFRLSESSPARWYVYFLIDPRDGRIFYVGKGSGCRMSDHVKAAVSAREGNGAKARMIAEILAAGMNVVETIFVGFDDEGAAYDCERELIARLRHAGLTNIAGGCWSAKALAKERARYMLARMKPLEEWLNSLSNETAGQIERVCGSPEAWYRRLVSVLEREAEDPSPNVIVVDVHGRVTFGWERA